VTDFLPDSPAIARPYCPSCEPDADPSSEILDVRWCAAHTPVSTGSHDDAVTTEAYLSGSAEAGGDDNRRWCEFFHAARREPTPKPRRTRVKQPA
jgi:hypothetical protein